jgi:hypothetical protein
VDDVLESISTMLSYQFTLGYSPRDIPGDDERREIEVRVDIDGDGHSDDDQLDLNYRPYYYPGKVR